MQFFVPALLLVAVAPAFAAPLHDVKSTKHVDLVARSPSPASVIGVIGKLGEDVVKDAIKGPKVSLNIEMETNSNTSF